LGELPPTTDQKPERKGQAAERRLPDIVRYERQRPAQRKWRLLDMVKGGICELSVVTLASAL
jgi:hypothetical protein